MGILDTLFGKHKPPVRYPYKISLTPPSTSRYFALLEDIERAHSQRRYYQALELSLEAIKWIPQFVRDVVGLNGRWDVTSLPTLEYACNYLPVLRRREDLQRIRTVINSVPELAEWLNEVDHALERADLMSKIESHILANPGFIQAKLGRELGVDGREVGNMLYYAQQLGIVRREKDGRSYRLYSEKAS